MGVRSPALRTGATAVAAWVLTVAPVVTVAGGNWPTRLAAAVALLCGVSAPVLVGPHPRLGRHVGISAFVVGVALSWGLAWWYGQVPASAGARWWLGALAWALYGASWSETSLAGSSQTRGGAVLAHGLVPRRRPSVAVVLWAGASVVLAALVFLIAWRVERPERALLAHVLGVAAGLGIIATGARLAVLSARLPEHVRDARRPPALRLGIAQRSVLVVGLLVALTVLLYLTRP